MSKKVWIIGSGVLLVALLTASVVGAGVAFAQSPLPAAGQGWQPAPVQGPPVPNPLRWLPGGDWTAFDAAAEALGLTPEELFAELHAGKTVPQIAEEQGMTMEEVQDALQAQRLEAQKDAIQQAVEEGRLTQEEADWLIQGLEGDFFAKLRRFLNVRGRVTRPAARPAF